MSKRRGAAAAGDEEHGSSSVTGTPGRDLVRAEHPIRRIADGTVEATCCAAVVMLPLYFSLLSPLGPETDKAVLLIALAGIAAAAWLVGQIDRFTHPDPEVWNALLWAGVIFFGIYALATALSIHPTISLYGTMARHEGLLTHAGYLVFFVCVATRIRRREQVRRLVSVLVFASIPTVAYGVLQEFGIDPAPTVGDISTIQWPVRSSFGQHIFFAAYLVMIIPLTGARFLQLWERRAEPASQGAGDEALLASSLILVAIASFLAFLALGKGHTSMFALLPALLAGITLLAIAFDELPDTRSMRSFRMWMYAALFGFGVLVLIFTNARGAWFGFFATLPVFALLVARRLDRPTIGRVILAGAAALLVFVGLLNIPGGPLQPLRSKPIFGRVANIQGYVNESSGAGRLLIWNGVETLMTRQPAVGNTWGGPLRAVVGYGPESMDNAFERVFPLKLRVETSEVYTWDRAHSIYLDVLVDAGVLGLLAFLITLGAFFWRLLRFRHPAGAGMSWLAIGAVSAVAGHMVEGIFGVETAASLLILWVILGLGAGPSLVSRDEERVSVAALPWARVTLVYWVVAVPVILLIGLVGPFNSYPGILTLIWVVAIAVGVGTVAWLVAPRQVKATPVRTKGKRGGEAQSRSSLGPTRGMVVAASVLAVLALFSQWNYETAATTQAAGFVKLTHGQIADGIADLQQAARLEEGQPKYAEDLATIYEGIASAKPVSAYPGYVPSGDDARTIDPQRVLQLGRDQLFELAVLSLHSARSLTPLDPGVYAALGDLYMSWGRPEPAIAAYRQAEGLSHDNPRYIDDEAMARLAQNRLHVAATLAAGALHLDPTFWYSYYTAAKVVHRLGLHAEARVAAAASLFFAPNARPGPNTAQHAELVKLKRSG